MTDAITALQSEVDHLRAQLADYAPLVERLKRAERALLVLTGQSRAYTRTSNVNMPGNASDMILGWIQPDQVICAEQVARALHISRNRAVVALNRLAKTGRLERAGRGRFKLPEVA